MEPATFLDAGRDSPALRFFLKHFRIALPASPRDVLAQVARAFARIPYENLSKIVKRDAESTARDAFRSPLEVLEEHAATGAGGTCFSLTAACTHVLRALGFQADVLLADRPYGADTHCALRVVVEGVPHLLDPGYLIVDPVPLAMSGSVHIETSFNELFLTPRDDGRRLDLATGDGSRRVHRLSFKIAPAGVSALDKAWEASFNWDMMRYPLLSAVRAEDGAQLYLQGTRFQIRRHGNLERQDIAVAALPELIEREFGIGSPVAANALAVLARKGELGGGAFTR